MNFDEAHPGCLVRGNFRGLQPITASVLVEVSAGIDGFIDCVWIEDGLSCSGLCEAADCQEQHYRRHYQK
jgi:hypothetical protein